MSEFESRKGSLSCTPEEIFDFMTDIRNFRQFVPDGNIDNIKVDKDSFSFRIPQMGKVDLHLSEKEPFSRVKYKGTALQSQDFALHLNITCNTSGKAEVNVKLTADMNPIMKMVAAEPVKRFLEVLINEMEKFRGWKNTTA
jgi:carbon monoxide dehydrogenase subunit G